MNLGLSVVGSLLFLSPGLALVVVRHMRGPSLVRRPLSSSGSVGVLVVVPAIATLSHGIALMLFALNDAWVANVGPVVTLSWPADPYPTFLAMLNKSDLPVDAGWKFAIGWACTYITLLSLASVLVYLASARVYDWALDKKLGPNERRSNESRLAYLLRIADKTDGSLIAAVRTKSPPYPGMFGWLGPLDSVQLAGNDELISIRLIGPSVFSIDSEYPQSLDAGYSEFDPPFETDVVHLVGGEVLSVEYFFLPTNENDPTIQLEDFQIPTPDQDLYEGGSGEWGDELPKSSRRNSIEKVD